MNDAELDAIRARHELSHCRDVCTECDDIYNAVRRDRRVLLRYVDELRASSDRYLEMTDKQIDHLGAENERLRSELAALREALAAEMDDTRNACATVNAENDRLRAELAALREAARKVTCMKCAGQGTIFVVDYIDVTGEFRSRKTCPDCADLRGLLQ